MAIMLFADERAESAIPDVLNVSKYIVATYGCDVETYYRPGMFEDAVKHDKLNPDRFTAAVPAVALTGYDIKPDGLNFTFGVTTGNATLVSTARLNGDQLRLAVVTLHEVGHLLGLVEPSCRNYDSRHSFEGHCRNDCIMRAVNTLSDLDRCVETVKRGVVLCGDCQGYL